jgi:predicted dehydrogenase
MTKLRWGILGAANIARKNWKALFHSGNNVVTAVAARVAAGANSLFANVRRNFAFATRRRALAILRATARSPTWTRFTFRCPRRCGKEWVIRGRAGGKHVLCEKPCAVNADGFARNDGRLRKSIACNSWMA